MVLLLILLDKKEPVKWEYTFLSNSTNPGGSKAVAEYLRQTTGVHVDASRRRPRKVVSEIPRSATFVHAARYVDPTISDFDALLQWAYAGGHLYVTGFYLSDEIEKSLDVSFHYQYESSDDTVSVVFVMSRDTVSAPRRALEYYITIEDTAVWTPLATIQHSDTQVVLARRSYGNGHITVCSVADAFTNHGILDTSTRQLSVRIVNDVTGPVVWDNYLRRAGSRGLDVVINEYESWRYAWNILLMSSIVYVVMAARRRQRIIPEIKPVKNASLEFVESIVELYWRRRDNGNLGQKISKQFREHVRRTVRVTVPMDDEGYVRSVADATERRHADMLDLVQRLRSVDAGWTPHNEELYRLYLDVKNFIRETT